MWELGEGWGVQEKERRKHEKESRVALGYIGEGFQGLAKKERVRKWELWRVLSL